MFSLDRRIGALERLAPSQATHPFVVRFVGLAADPVPLSSLKAFMSGQQWDRLPDEAEQVFIDRVAAEVPSRPNGRTVLIGT